jgi:hypothetical protein
MQWITRRRPRIIFVSAADHPTGSRHHPGVGAAGPSRRRAAYRRRVHPARISPPTLPPRRATAGRGRPRATWLLPVLAAGLLTATTACADDPPARPEPPVTPASAPVVAAAPERVPPSVRTTTTAPAEPAAPSPRRTRTAPAEDPGRALDRFLTAVRQQLPEVVVDRRDEEVAALGIRACDALTAGKTRAAAARTLAEEGLTSDQAGTIVELARGTTCRQ